MDNFGIFIRSLQDKDTIIEKCLNLLDSLQTDTKILHGPRDEAHGGFKVVFDKDEIVPQLLKKKNLDDISTIHALTTVLIVQEALTNDEVFKEAIRNEIAVKVANIRKVPFSEQHPEIGNGQWIIILDVPEIEDLGEFMAMGLPNNMSLKLPNNNDKLKVEFYCRLCHKGGHTSSRCLGEGQSRCLVDAQERDQAFLEALKVTLGREEVQRLIQNNEVLFEVKKEKDANEVPLPHTPLSRECCISEAASSTSKDDVEILFESRSRSGSYSGSIQSPLENDEPTTNNQPPAKRPLSDDAENSNPSKRQSREMVPIKKVTIPDGIRKIVSNMTDKVLDIEELEAFFTHAKKKIKPVELAEKYTSDVEGLKKQLAEISRQYYRLTSVSKADIQFVKTLDNLLKRFENTTPKRASVSMNQQQG